MLPIVKRLLSLISIVALFISCASQEGKTSNGEEASQVESYVRVLPKSELQFPGTNSVCSVTIESSDSWEISGTNDWCSVSSTQGYSGDRVVISVADNMHDDDRSVNLVVSCGDVETTICVVQDPKIETSYVDVGFDNGETISGYNKSTGEVAITYSNDNIPDVAKGNTIVLSDEYMFDIRVIESVSSDGDTFTYSTTQGNIWDVFSDVSFTLASNDDILAMDIDGTPVVIPVAKGYLDANGKYVEVYNKYPSSTKTNKRVAQAKSAGYDLVANYHAARDYDEHRGGPSPSAMPYSQYDYEYDSPYYDDYYDDYYYDYEEPDDTYMSVTEEEAEIYFNNSSDNFTTGVEWNFRQDYSGLDIYNGDYGRLWMEKCAFDAGLSCTFEFKFGDSDSDSFFGMMGDLEYFSCMLRGSFGADLLLRYHYYDSMSYSDDKIVKYNVIPTQIYTFVICGVPVHLLIYTHLGQYAEMGLSSGIDASGGVDMGLDMEAGISWSKEDGVKFTKGATPHLTVYPLTLSANTSAYAKVSYYPQIEIGLYGRFGPWFEPRPYIKQEVETGFTLSTGDDYYDSWKSTLYGGLDMRMGLKVDFGFYDKDLWTSKVFSVVDDTPLYTAPKRISLESPSAGDIVVDVNESVNVSFKVDDYCSITDKYSKCSNAFVTFKANGGTLSKTYDATDSSGIANVSWTPFTSSSDTLPKTLTAYIYDGKGNIIDKATLEVNLKGVDDTPKEEPKKDTSNTHNGHEYVDLGLPSGVKWATCDIGADTPEESGDTFAWGEITQKAGGADDDPNLVTMDDLMNENCKTYGQSMDDISGNANYDVARAKWGGKWRMPTYEECMELMSLCYCYDKGHWDYVLSSKRNGNEITLCGSYYWSSVPYNGDDRMSYVMDLDRRKMRCNDRRLMFYVRPVFSDNENILNDKQNEGIDNGYEYVDLGLPSGVKWATCNVGADSPEEFGDYYAWGEIKPKENYVNKNYNTYSPDLADISRDVNYDAARANWGGGWRMPTWAEMDELMKYCTWRWTTLGGKPGFNVISKSNNNSIFLPAAGYYNGSSLCEVGVNGGYWSSSPASDYSQDSYGIGFTKDRILMFDYSCYFGHTIRPVLD